MADHARLVGLFQLEFAGAVGLAVERALVLKPGLLEGALPIDLLLGLHREFGDLPERTRCMRFFSSVIGSKRYCLLSRGQGAPPFCNGVASAPGRL